ncbi:hypothetical protein EDB83DRAFT_2318329 [Lactarius deliciosus]|nr:hypothetical protein EDB83DRAFT_2318329 [Lactarius deliciosus]
MRSTWGPSCSKYDSTLLGECGGDFAGGALAGVSGRTMAHGSLMQVSVDSLRPEVVGYEPKVVIGFESKLPGCAGIVDTVACPGSSHRYSSGAPGDGLEVEKERRGVIIRRCICGRRFDSCKSKRQIQFQVGLRRPMKPWYHGVLGSALVVLRTSDIRYTSLIDEWNFMRISTCAVSMLGRSGDLTFSQTRDLPTDSSARRPWFPIRANAMSLGKRNLKKE